MTDSPGASAARSTGHRWLLLEWTATVWRETRRLNSTLPPGAWKTWTYALAVGFVLCGAVTAGMTVLARELAEQGLQQWDSRSLQLVMNRGFSFINGMILQSPGNLIYLGPVTLASMVVAIRRGRLLAAASVPAAYILVRMLVFVGWSVWDRARPDLVANGIAAPDLHSFPSGHAALSVATYGFLAYLWFRAAAHWSERVFVVVVLILWTGSISFARLALGTHWPSDVIAGLVVGALWLAVVVHALRRAEGSPQHSRLSGGRSSR